MSVAAAGGVGGPDDPQRLEDSGEPGATPAAPAPAPAGGLADPALHSAFPSGLAASLRSGARGPQVVAVQYALGRLGYLTSLADGSFGPATAAAVAAFQRARGLPESGAVDAASLSALDGALRAYDPSTPAARAPDPLRFLSDFAARGISPVAVEDSSKPIDWSNPEIQAAYGKFVGEYWEVLKANRVETDCKTLALFFMDQFRAKVKQDLGATLPLPGSGEAKMTQPLKWQAVTAARPQGYFSRVDQLKQVRPGFQAVRAIEALDPKHSMIEGVNLHAGNIGTDLVARAATTVDPWNPALEDHGDTTRPEIPVQDLAPGMIVFLDHGDGKWDHTVNVVGVTRDDDGRVQQLKLAVGSYDDMKDTDPRTAPRGTFEVDDYAEELTVDLDASGTITGSQTTWTSEPRYEVAPRYGPQNTIIDLHPGARLKVARWGDPPA
jgi:peptidoglycan hydrolase-like protein with peptidoglycan-binding domain